MQEVALGQKVQARVATFNVSSVKDITEDVSNEFSQDDGEWAALIKICSTGDWGGPIAPMSHFHLLDADGGTYQPNGMSGGGYHPSPQLDPGSLNLSDGQCRKGNLFFDAPAGTKITEIEVTDSDGATMGTWKVTTQ